jgi:phage gp45-like
MKKLLQISILIFLFIGMTEIRVHAQAIVNAQVFAEVIGALTATETSQLNFGRFSPETAGGQVLVTPQGGRSANGTVILVTGTHNPATFYITGDFDASYSITLPTAPVTITNVKNSKIMQVTDWKSIPAAGNGVATLRGGSEIVNIGATLLVGNVNDNPTGTYTGTYTITFAYN